MPQITYKPEGADPRTWEVQFSKLLTSEVSAIQKASGLRYGQFEEEFFAENGDLLRALVWVFLKRSAPTLTLAQVDPSMNEIALDLTGEEKARLRDELVRRRSAGESLDEQEAVFLAELEKEIGPHVEPAKDDVEPGDEYIGDDAPKAE